MGPALDTFQDRPERHVCLFISMPILFRLLEGDVPKIRVDAAGDIQCNGHVSHECVVGRREYMGNGRLSLIHI
eukprot:9716375-Alexandrium_andersonii.AAC.1